MPDDRDSFQLLLGEDLSFFNKDANQENLFALRKQALEHDDECDCDFCKHLTLLEQLGLGLG